MTHTNTAKAPIRVAVTGAAGQIAYSLLFRIAAGDMLGADQPVILQLLDLPQAQQAVQGVIMELHDCAFPLLADVFATSGPEAAFQDAEIAILVGARPRSKGMERADLLHANANIFTAQGAALNKVASRNVKVLVVGNPANTNAYIAMKSAPDLPARNFTAMLRLDHNRALNQIALKIGHSVNSINQLCVWGNHSPSMYTDYRFATVNGQSVQELIGDAQWNTEHFLPTVAKRGAAIIWVLGSNGRWVTMGVPSDGAYGIPEGLIFGLPVVCENGEYRVIKDLPIDDFSREHIGITLKELEDERAAVAHLL